MTDKFEIILVNMDEWKSFAAANLEAIVNEYGSTANAYRHAIDGGLRLGGGAAPLFHVSFAQ
jgi:hypothetical protein